MSKPKLAAPSTFVRSAHMCVLITVYNYNTQYSTEQFWLSPLLSSRQSPQLRLPVHLLQGRGVRTIQLCWVVYRYYSCTLSYTYAYEQFLQVCRSCWCRCSLTVFVHFYMCFLSQFSLFFVFSFCIFVVFFLVVKPVQIIAWKDSLCKMC